MDREGKDHTLYPSPPPPHRTAAAWTYRAQASPPNPYQRPRDLLAHGRAEEPPKVFRSPLLPTNSSRPSSFRTRHRTTPLSSVSPDPPTPTLSACLCQPAYEREIEPFEHGQG
eukprot:scaffold14014_cov146-Isochrysis_galbana.AAC.1